MVSSFATPLVVLSFGRLRPLITIQDDAAITILDVRQHLDEGDVEKLHGFLERAAIELVEEVDPALPAVAELERAPEKRGRRKPKTALRKSLESRLEARRGNPEGLPVLRIPRPRAVATETPSAPSRTHTHSSGQLRSAAASAAC